MFAIVTALSNIFCSLQAQAFDPLLGTSFSPAHIPKWTDADGVRFFTLAKELGSHVTFISEWKDQTPLNVVSIIRDGTRKHGLKFHLYLSPIALNARRDTASVPPSVNGSSFTQPSVRAAFIKSALDFASLKPDVLGLATEVNFLAANATEYGAFKSLAAEAYRQVKSKYPNQTVTLSFQWDVMITRKAFSPLSDFAPALDIYSFTSYPFMFARPENLPGEYYSSLRKLLPTQRIGFSEIGWTTSGANESGQARFFQRLPDLMAGARPEYLTLALMHDVRLFQGELASLNACGVRNWDGSPKPAWEVLKRLHFKNRE